MVRLYGWVGNPGLRRVYRLDRELMSLIELHVQGFFLERKNTCADIAVMAKAGLVARGEGSRRPDRNATEHPQHDIRKA